MGRGRFAALLTLALGIAAPAAAKGDQRRHQQQRRSGTCLFIEKISGEDLEAGQDAKSLQVST